MIAVRIDPSNKDKDGKISDDYTRLGEYIAAAKETGEKLDRFWIVNCNAGTDLKDLKRALYEIEAAQIKKSKNANKTYHLMVSFRPGEREKLSAEDLKDIEREFAKALGYADHRRVVGTHINTDNFHMHVAYSKIHPETHRCHTPRKDFYALEETCRAMEKKYGLFVDKGLSDTKEREKATRKARQFEARTWQQSFESHLIEHRAEILAAIGEAKTWADVHKGLAEFDAGLKKRGAGLAFVHLKDARRTMKASVLDRSCSLASLENRFGRFEPVEQKPEDRTGTKPRKSVQPRYPYLAKPMFSHPGQDRLWRLYQSQQRRPGFLARSFHIRNWKSYLLADAHKDALALVTILFYKELLHNLEGGNSRGAPIVHEAPKAIRPALQAWFSSLPWKSPKTALKMPPYVPGVGLKVDEAGRVLFPMRDAEGYVWAVRAVDAQGRFCDIGDMSARPGLRHILDQKTLHKVEYRLWSNAIVLTSDCVDASAIRKATGLPVVAVAREEDLTLVASEFRHNYPENAIVVAAPPENRAAEKAVRQIGGRSMTPDSIIENVLGAFVEAPPCSRRLTCPHKTSNNKGKAAN